MNQFYTIVGRYGGKEIPLDIVNTEKQAIDKVQRLQVEYGMPWEVTYLYPGENRQLRPHDSNNLKRKSIKVSR